MSVKVKICGLRDEEAIAAAVEAGADAVGFVFAASPREITPADAYRVATKVPDHILRVAVMRHPSNERWQHVLETFEPDVLQVDMEDLAGLDIPQRMRTWPVVREGDSVSEWPAEFVYEGRKSGVGETVNWQRAAGCACNGRMVLAGGLNAENVAAAVRAVQPWGVDVSSGVESAPGDKKPELIREFIKAVRAAEKNT